MNRTLRNYKICLTARTSPPATNFSKTQKNPRIASQDHLKNILESYFAEIPKELFFEEIIKETFVRLSSNHAQTNFFRNEKFFKQNKGTMATDIGNLDESCHIFFRIKFGFSFKYKYIQLVLIFNLLIVIKKLFVTGI